MFQIVHPIQPMHPECLVGNVDNILAQTDLFRPDWPLTVEDLGKEVEAVLIDQLRWPRTMATHRRAKAIARVIARYRFVAAA
jgi:hypothetical protein